MAEVGSVRGENEFRQKIINLKKWAQEYAEKNGFALNPDEQIVDRVVEGLLKNEGKYKVRYCPCRLPTGDREKDIAIICPCIYHKDEIEKDGHCRCRLFVKK